MSFSPRAVSRAWPIRSVSRPRRWRGDHSVVAVLAHRHPQPYRRPQDQPYRRASPLALRCCCSVTAPHTPARAGSPDAYSAHGDHQLRRRYRRSPCGWRSARVLGTRRKDAPGKRRSCGEDDQAGSVYAVRRMASLAPAAGVRSHGSARLYVVPTFASCGAVGARHGGLPVRSAGGRTQRRTERNGGVRLPRGLARP